MQRRWIIGGLAVVALVVALLARERGRAVPPAAPGETPVAASAAQLDAWDGGAITKTTHDRRIRDELQRRIIEALLRAPLDGGSTTAEDPTSGTAPVPPPRAYGDNTELDHAYIQHVMREDLFPLAMQCYQQLLERQPDAGGKVVLHFGIVGDPHLGGYVDDATIDAGTPEDIQDPEMQTCIRESMLSVAFAPPAKGGAVTVEYPFEFSP